MQEFTTNDNNLYAEKDFYQSPFIHNFIYNTIETNFGDDFINEQNLSKVKLAVEEVSIGKQPFLRMKKLIVDADTKIVEAFPLIGFRRSENQLPDDNQGQAEDDSNYTIITFNDYCHKRKIRHVKEDIVRIDYEYRMCPENVFFSSTFQEKYLKMLNNHFDPNTTYVIYNQYQYVKDNSSFVDYLYQVLGMRTVYNDCELTEDEKQNKLFAPFEAETKDTYKMSISEWLLRRTDKSISKEDNLRQNIKTYVEQPGAYKRFHESVVKQVLGQPELNKVTYNVFTWMKSIANGTSVKHNTMLAAPSGCGKTETFKAIKKVFQDNGLNIPVILTDITQLTPEGFKGRDTTDFLMPLMNPWNRYVIECR